MSEAIDSRNNDSFSTVVEKSDAESASNSPHVDLRPGKEVGRYILLDQLGHGAMGVVWSAYDPKLDRKVALKFLLSGGGTRVSEMWERLSLEGRALARVSHPNVAPVYDVGLHGTSIFIALQYIQGKTLRRWLDDRDQNGERELDWRAALDLLLPAGRGLEAAHEVGLIHRDYKPDNTMVDQKGRVWVLDFGIASIEGSSSEHIARATDSGHDLHTESLTRTGVLMGTPGYMSPEQYRRERVDSRSDQFSYCVVLYEVLFGHRPFAGNNLSTLKKNILEENLLVPDRVHKVPNRLWSALKRGLSQDPRARYPDMTSLLLELKRIRDSSSPQRRSLQVLAALMLIVPAFTWAQSRNDAITPCEDNSYLFDDIWSEERQEKIQKAFLASGTPGAEHLFTNSAKHIESYLERWGKMKTDSCLATRVMGTQSEHEMDLRSLCMSSHLTELNSLLGLFEHANRALVSKSVDAAKALPSLSHCADIDTLGTVEELPSDERLRGQIASARDQLSEIRVLRRVGQASKAHTKLKELLSSTQDISYRPLQAELKAEWGDLMIRFGEGAEGVEALQESVSLSLESNHEELLRKASIDLLATYSVALRKPEEAELWAKLATAFHRRGSPSPEESALYENAYSNFEHMRGDEREAERRAEAAVQLIENNELENEVNFANIITSWAITLSNTDQIDRALEQWERVIAIGRENYGNLHLAVSLGLANKAETLYRAERYEEASDAIRESLEIQRQLDPHPRITAYILVTASLTASQLGNYSIAAEQAKEAISIMTDFRGAGASLELFARIMYGDALRGQEKYEKALEQCALAVAGYRGMTGSELHLASAQLCTGHTLLAMNHARTALEELGAFVEETDAIKSVDTLTRIEARTLVGRLLRESGRSQEALVRLNEAHALLDELPIYPSIRRPEILTARSEVLFDLGSYEEAKTDARLAMLLRKDSIGDQSIPKRLHALWPDSF